MTENEIAKIVVDAAFHIHTDLGPGLLESVYQTVMTHELRKRGLAVQPQAPISIVYNGVALDKGFNADLLVEDLVIIELKSVEELHPIHAKQLLTYLRLSQKRLGLLINFNTRLIKNGITRVVNGLPE